jgi:hypothetical protein
MKYMVIPVLLLVSHAILAQDPAPIDDAGHKLQQFYLNLHVEQLWISGHHINWQTGQPDDPESTEGIKTHCSAFVASACMQLNVYILRPPDHGQVLLADAQFAWLGSADARDKGWQLLSGSDEYDIYTKAQSYANKGYVVAAAWNNPSAHEPGHIALVMPKDISQATIQDSGPVVIMASTNNYNFISLKNGFRRHITSWPAREILFYYNTHKAF